MAAYRRDTMEDDELEHEHYGHYNETPHADLELTTDEWLEGVQQVLVYQIGPPVAWHYEGGICFIWGDQLDEQLLREIADACNDLEQEFARDGMYDAAQSAERAASQVIRADVHEAGEAMIT